MKDKSHVIAPKLDNNPHAFQSSNMKLRVFGADWLRFSNVVVMAGAGISVSANLPDFRSKGGLYDQLRHTTNITSPETIFTSALSKRV